MTHALPQPSKTYLATLKASSTNFKLHTKSAPYLYMNWQERRKHRPKSLRRQKRGPST
jgi:hypothetical protein